MTTKSEPVSKETHPATSDPEPDGADAVRASSQETREAIVRSSGSGYTVVRHVLVQRHEGDDRTSTLARFIRTRKHRALVLYLLLLTAWDKDRPPFAANVWRRALEVDDGTTTWSPSSVSQAWSDLVAMNLVDRRRERRRAKLTPRREDGEAEYSRPNGETTIDRYFVLPGEFWTDRWFDQLSLPALCVLLIILKETNDKQHEIHLTYEQTARWYGVSAKSAQKGYKELAAVGLATVRRAVVKDAFAPEGLTFHYYYSLTGAFSTQSRSRARRAAKKAATSRQRKTAAASRAPKRTKKLKKATKKKGRQ